jgi:hypothetical protein
MANTKPVAMTNTEPVAIADAGQNSDRQHDPDADEESQPNADGQQIAELSVQTIRSTFGVRWILTFSDLCGPKSFCEVIKSQGFRSFYRYPRFQWITGISCFQ